MDKRAAVDRGLAWYQRNTGVSPGTVLRQSGPVNVTVDGTVVEGLEINGDLTFTAANVTIRNCIVHGQISNQHMGTGAGAWYDDGYYGQNILIEHTEVDAPKNVRAVVSPWSTTMRYLKIHGGVQSTSFAGYNTIEDSYFYDLRSDDGGHAENILANGNPDPLSGNTVIARNWLDAADTNARTATGTLVSGALAMFGDFGQIKNITVEDNYLTGAGYLLYAGAVPGKPYPLPRNVAVRNNVFAPVGQWGWGPVFPAALDSASQAQWANNRLANGTTVQPPN